MITKNFSRLGVALSALVMLGTLSGCASNRTTDPSDPLEPSNRAFHKINDSIDSNFFQPVARGYAKVTPPEVRNGVTNFYDNLTYLNVIFNDLLQGKLKQGLADSGRFLLNSTLGFGGLFDPATQWGLKNHDEDLGQTFGAWGAGEGAYLVLPFFGPDTVRDVPDRVTSALLNPLFWFTSTISIPLTVINAVNTRANLLEATRVRDEAALDPYTFTREAFRQRRQYLIHDGNPPSEGFEEFIEEADERDTSVLKVF